MFMKFTVQSVVRFRKKTGKIKKCLHICKHCLHMIFTKKKNICCLQNITSKCFKLDKL